MRGHNHYFTPCVTVVSMCVVYVYVLTCGHMDQYVYGWRCQGSSCSAALRLSSLRHCYPLNPQLGCGQQAAETPPMLTMCRGCRRSQACLEVDVGAWCLNSGLPVCTANALTCGLIYPVSGCMILRSEIVSSCYMLCMLYVCFQKEHIYLFFIVFCKAPKPRLASQPCRLTEVKSKQV